jgi:dTDP-4-dehydrorhamnose 3,5-epimerase
MNEPLQIASILPKYREQIVQQDYSAKDKIEGVEFIDLPHFTDDGGTFIEVARLTAGQHDWVLNTGVEQVSFSEMLPGVTKAFHIHFNQEDVWFVPPSSRMLIGLHDAREHSPTSGQTMRFILGGGKAKLVRIPRGVAHGVRNIGDTAGYIFYFVSQKFSPKDTDERRLPWDLLGEDFWEITKG